MPTQVKRMSPKEFQDFGYLQEINRQFLHPLGLALEVLIEEGTSKVTLGGIWDFRDEPEGIVFAAGQLEQPKADRVAAARQEKAQARKLLLGDIVQSVQPEHTKDK